HSSSYSPTSCAPPSTDAESSISRIPGMWRMPPLRRPDIEGNLVDLAAPRGVPLKVLFWSPGCTHCLELAPAIRAVEQHPYRPEMIIVSRGPMGLTEDAGFTSPAIFDDDRVIARTFTVGRLLRRLSSTAMTGLPRRS